jgi:hypothetical protein
MLGQRDIEETYIELPRELHSTLLEEGYFPVGRVINEGQYQGRWVSIEACLDYLVIQAIKYVPLCAGFFC